MAKQRLYSRAVVGHLGQSVDPADQLVFFLKTGLKAMQSVGDPEWSTLKVTIDRDELFLDQHAITITAIASSKED